MPEMKATPRNSVLGMIADTLKKAREVGNKADLPIVGGLGDLLIGKMPDEVNEWSYGNAPLQVVGGGTGSRVPQVKQGRAEGLVDTLLNGPGLAQTAKALPKMTVGALDRMAQNSAPALVRQAGAVKPRGGNWLKQSGLEYLDDMLQRPPGNGRVPAEVQTNYEAANPAMGALNSWVRGPMTNYTRRDLGTAKDPLIGLANEGISTLTPQELLNPQGWIKDRARGHRAVAGFPSAPTAEGGYGQGWETIGDAMTAPYPKHEVIQNLGSYADEFAKREPGFDKIPDDAMTYQFTGDEAPYHLGFDRVVASLKYGLQEGANLPPGLRLKPEDLQQMGMEKAVRYMNDVENFKKVEAERQAARLAEQMGKQGKLVKEFPSGHRMVELRRPEALDEQMAASVRKNIDGSFSPLDADGKVIQRRNALGGNLTDVVEQNAEDAYLGGMLANEGNAMQHCVGGYCSDVSSGRTKIYSIRDAKGEPHVTIEAQIPTLDQMSDADLRSLQRSGFYGESPSSILQVFGKQNTKPKDEYLHAIQDFIRSGGFHVADEVLENTGLKNVNGKYYTPQEMEVIKLDGKHPDQPWVLDYLANEEIRGYKDGGLIQGDDDFAMPGHF